MGPTKANHLPSRVEEIALFGESSPKYYLLWENNVNSSEKGCYASEDTVVTDGG